MEQPDLASLLESQPALAAAAAGSRAVLGEALCLDVELTSALRRSPALAAGIARDVRLMRALLRAPKLPPGVAAAGRAARRDGGGGVAAVPGAAAALAAAYAAAMPSAPGGSRGSQDGASMQGGFFSSLGSLSELEAQGAGAAVNWCPLRVVLCRETALAEALCAHYVYAGEGGAFVPTPCQGR